MHGWTDLEDSNTYWAAVEFGQEITPAELDERLEQAFMVLETWDAFRHRAWAQDAAHAQATAFLANQVCACLITAMQHILCHPREPNVRGLMDIVARKPKGEWRQALAEALHGLHVEARPRETEYVRLLDDPPEVRQGIMNGTIR